MPLRSVVILAVMLVSSCGTTRAYVDAPPRYGWTSPILLIGNLAGYPVLQGGEG